MPRVVQTLKTDEIASACVTISYARCHGSTLIPLSLLYRDDADASVRRPHADGPRLGAVSRSVWK